jgi:hypothetical protein
MTQTKDAAQDLDPRELYGQPRKLPVEHGREHRAHHTGVAGANGGFVVNTTINPWKLC